MITKSELNPISVDSTPSRLSLSRWFVDPPRRRFLLPVTGAWILALDWLFFSQDIVTLGLSTPFLVVAGFLLGGIGTLFLQRRFGKDGWPAALGKALLAGIVVGIPLPIFGTVIGGWILLASGLHRDVRSPDDRSKPA